MPNDVCPACLGGEIKAVDTVAASGLKKLYSQVGLDVSPYLDATSEIRMNKCLACDLGFFEPHCAGDDVFYEQLQKFDWYYQSEKPEYGYSRRFISDADTVLEVGCGKGAFRSWLPASTEYTGLEFNDAAIRRARSDGLHVLKQPVQEHAESAPEKYDVVCSFQVLEHVPEPRGFVQGCVRALKPGGKLILAVPAEDSFLSIASDAHLNMPPHHALRWTDRALRNLAAREGLSVVDLWHEPVASFHEDWHKDTLAHHYFVRLGLNKHKLVGRTFMGKLLGRLFRKQAIRNFFAAKAAKQFPLAKFGHTVVLVAGKPAS
jgi:2-polyprenyl-3-methyl-5-hydroxy-6-metoxy-1,4-benzoquinol methylase